MNCQTFWGPLRRTGGTRFGRSAPSRVSDRVLSPKYSPRGTRIYTVAGSDHRSWTLDKTAYVRHTETILWRGETRSQRNEHFIPTRILVGVRETPKLHYQVPCVV